MSQLALDLVYRAAQGREDFMVADCNADAVAWIDRWRDWPLGRLALYGAPGSGKSHLVEVWRAESGAALLPLTALNSEGLDGVIAEGGALALDAADLLKPGENRWGLPGTRVDHGVQVLGQDSIEVLFEAAPRDVSQSVHDLLDMVVRLH